MHILCVSIIHFEVKFREEDYEKDEMWTTRCFGTNMTYIQAMQYVSSIFHDLLVVCITYLYASPANGTHSLLEEHIAHG